MGLRCACARGRMVVTAYLTLQLLRRCGTYVCTCVCMYKLLCAGDGGSVWGFCNGSCNQAIKRRVIQPAFKLLLYVHAHLLLAKYCHRTSPYFSRLSLFVWLLRLAFHGRFEGPALAMASSQWMELQIRV